MKKHLLIITLVCLWVTTYANFSTMKDRTSVLVYDTLFMKKLLVSDTIMLERQIFSIEVYDIAHYAYLLKGSNYDLYIKHHEQGYIALKIDHYSTPKAISFWGSIKEYPYCFGFGALLIILCISIYILIPCNKKQ